MQLEEHCLNRMKAMNIYFSFSTISSLHNNYSKENGYAFGYDSLFMF